MIEYELEVQNMFKKMPVICLSLLVVLASGALALGPVELMLYGGVSLANYSGGYDLGASAMLDLPMIPKVGVEIERSGLAGNVNITRMGLVYEQSIIPFLASFKVSAGSTSISSDGSFSIGSYTFPVSASASGTYMAAGLVFKLLSLAVNPKYVYNQYSGVAVSEAIVNAGLTF